jgi:hypothetical protein
MNFCSKAVSVLVLYSFAPLRSPFEIHLGNDVPAFCFTSQKRSYLLINSVGTRRTVVNKGTIAL